MSSPSVSFRISRSAEDLAATIHALSQRLVKLEQRLAAMELQVVQTQQSDPEELASLDNVERLLQDCRDLLEDGVPGEAPFAGLDSDGLEPEALEHDLSEEEEEAEHGPRGFGEGPQRRDGYPSAA